MNESEKKKDDYEKLDTVNVQNIFRYLNGLLDPRNAFLPRRNDAKMCVQTLRHYPNLYGFVIREFETKITYGMLPKKKGDLIDKTRGLS